MRLEDIPVTEALVVRTGDTLIIGFSCRITEQIAASIQERLIERLPGLKFVIIDQVSAMAVEHNEYRDAV